MDYGSNVTVILAHHIDVCLLLWFGKHLTASYGLYVNTYNVYLPSRHMAAAVLTNHHWPFLPPFQRNPVKSRRNQRYEPTL